MSTEREIERVRREDIARRDRHHVEAITDEERTDLQAYASLRFPERPIKGPWARPCFEADLADVLVQHGD